MTVVVKPAPKTDGLGFFFPVVLINLTLEYARPANSLRVPMISSFLLLAGWLVQRNKKWSPQATCALVLLAVMAFDLVIVAPNTYWAFWTTYDLFILIACVCIPSVQFVDRLRKIRVLINTLIAVFVYVGVYAIFHGGFGPGGAAGAQDENYVGGAMAMAFPLAFFSFFSAKSVLAKFAFASACAILVLGCVAGSSRGAFLAMGAVFLYCWLLSPKKLLALVVAGVLVVLALLAAPAAYWQDMSTITDLNDPTTDLRIEFWKLGWRMFLAYPLTGIGPGNYLWNTVAYQSSEQFETFGRGLRGVAHSLYVELLAELGLVGVGLFVLIFYRNVTDLGWVTQRAGKELQAVPRTADPDRERDPSDWALLRHYGLAIGGSFIAFAVMGISLSLLYFSYFWVLTMLAVALRNVTRERVDSVEPLREGR